MSGDRYLIVSIVVCHKSGSLHLQASINFVLDHRLRKPRPTSVIAQRSCKPPATPVFHKICPLTVCGILASLYTHSLRSRSKYILISSWIRLATLGLRANGRAQRSCYTRRKPHKTRSSTVIYVSHASKCSRAPAWSPDMRSAISKPLMYKIQAKYLMAFAIRPDCHGTRADS